MTKRKANISKSGITEQNIESKIKRLFTAGFPTLIPKASGTAMCENADGTQYPSNQNQVVIP